MQPLSVAHISTWKIPCGIATYCENLVTSLSKLGVDNTVLPIHPATWKSMLPVDIENWVNETIEATSNHSFVHIQHEHGIFGHELGAKFSLKRFRSLLDGFSKKGKPCVVTFHTDPPPCRKRGLERVITSQLRRYRWKKYIGPYFRDHCKNVFAIVHSPNSRKVFVKHGLSAERIRVLQHPCLAPRHARLENSEAKLQLGYASDIRLITLFGFLGKYKGHDLVMEALRKLPPNYHFAMVGGMHPEAKDNYLDSLLNQMPNDLAQRIRITGWVDKQTADKYFAATDVCVAPYRGDTLLAGSGALTWGLSSGKPVIASKIEAFTSVNREAECMLMFTPDMVNELAWAIERVDTNESLRNRLVSNATQYCEKNSWEKLAPTFLEVYEELASGHLDKRIVGNQRAAA